MQEPHYHAHPYKAVTFPYHAALPEAFEKLAVVHSYPIPCPDTLGTATPETSAQPGYGITVFTTVSTVLSPVIDSTCAQCLAHFYSTFKLHPFLLKNPDSFINLFVITSSQVSRLDFFYIART